MITSAQLRAARVMLGLSQADIASRACLSVPTIKRAEADAGINVSESVRAAVKAVLEKAGIEFISENGGGAGVRMRERREAKSA